MQLSVHSLKVFLLLVVYASGILVFSGVIPIDNFEKLTPYNLLFSSLLLFASRENFRRSFAVFFVLIFISGFIIEWVGVTTGWVFGNYTYGESLGFKISGVPVIIGLNWVMVVYISGVMSERFMKNIHAKAITAAALMVLLDVFIEPFAMRYDLWQWENHSVPLQNYAAWFLCGWLMQYIFYTTVSHRTNTLATPLYIIQLIFFLTLLVA